MKQVLRTFVCLILPIISMAESHAYVPLVREGVEWGYVQVEWRRPDDLDKYDWEKYERIGKYFRFQFCGTTEIDGKVYYNLYQYSTNNLDAKQETPKAWFREDCGKVYSILNPENTEDFFYYHPSIHNYSSEAMVFDFSMTKGDKFYDPDGEHYLICDEEGFMDIKDGEERKFLSLSYGDDYAFNFFGSIPRLLIEGIGPVVDSWQSSTILYPYYHVITGFEYFLGMLLYERKVRDDGYQGEIVYESPLFGEFAPYDKSVTEWERHPGEDSLESVMASNVKIECIAGEIIASCADAEISAIELHAIDGSLISRAAATGTEVRLRAPAKGFAILTVTLSNGATHTTKLHLK